MVQRLPDRAEGQGLEIAVDPLVVGGVEEPSDSGQGAPANLLDRGRRAHLHSRHGRPLRHPGVRRGRDIVGHRRCQPDIDQPLPVDVLGQRQRPDSGSGLGHGGPRLGQRHELLHPYSRRRHRAFAAGLYGRWSRPLHVSAATHSLAPSRLGTGTYRILGQLGMGAHRHSGGALQRPDAAGTRPNGHDLLWVLRHRNHAGHAFRPAAFTVDHERTCAQRRRARVDHQLRRKPLHDARADQQGAGPAGVHPEHVQANCVRHRPSRSAVRAEQRRVEWPGSHSESLVRARPRRRKLPRRSNPGGWRTSGDLRVPLEISYTGTP